MSILCLTFLFGCNKEEKVYYADQDFVKSVQKGLESRWETVMKNEGNNVKTDADLLNSYIDLELKEIEKYQEEKFEDSVLQENAIKYINTLNAHKNITEYYSVDLVKYNKEFAPINSERSKIIALLVEKYDLKVADKYQKTLNDFLTKSKLAIEDDKVKQAVEEMINSLEFTVVDTSYSYKTYQAILENTAEKDFKSLSFTINLIDENGVIVDTAYCHASNFNKGAKVQLDFLTDKDFVITEITAEWYN